jgi:hypothetical protein
MEYVASSLNLLALLTHSYSLANDVMTYVR